MLGNLSIRDLLNARLTSRSFVRLSQLPSVAMDWQTVTEEQAASLTLFLSRHFMQPKSPHLYLQLQTAQGVAVHFQTVLACSCANLKSLNVSNLLSGDTAQALLGMLPVSLVSLDIASCASIIESPTWGRLKALTSLILWIVPAPPAHPVRRSRLAELSSLQYLAFRVTDDVILSGERAALFHRMCLIEGCSFWLPNVISLRMEHDPFKGGLDLAQLPRLQVIPLASSLDVPSWLQGQPLPALQLESSCQLGTVDTRQILCGHLHIRSPACSVPWQLSSLLHMPLLKELHLTMAVGATDHDPDARIRLEGPLEMHSNLLQKVHAIFVCPVVLDVAGPASKSVLRLQRNGHAVTRV